jgi:hypothetical protein
MSRRDLSHQCYVCKRKYAGEDLGRVCIAELPSRKGNQVFRVVCQTCFLSIQMWYRMELHEEPPLLHGF